MNHSPRHLARLIAAAAALALAPFFGGCIGGPGPGATTQMATDIDPATTQPSHWLSEPSPFTVDGTDFDALWSAAEDVIRKSNFQIDREDYRSGLLTTLPVVSKQWFEFWRSDGASLHDTTESSLAGIRRTLYFQFERLSTGGYRVAPKVLVERYTSVEPKLRSTTYYDPTYWTPVRRDDAMEKRLAEMISDRIHKS